MWRSSLIRGAVMLGAAMLCAEAAPAAGPTGQAGALAATLAVERITLPSGLVVILNEDHRAPVVGYDLQIDVGARDDPPGRRGMAALIRQVLVHATTRHLGEKSREAVLQALDAPRWTPETGHSLDGTWVHARVPSGALELALWMESDRLAFAEDGVDAEAVRKAAEDAERGLARSEGGIDGRVRDEIFVRVWGRGHPYGGASHGAPELGGVTAAEVRARLRALYGPANAVLALVGDFDRAQARELCARYFGGIAGGARLARTAMGPAALRGEQRVRIEAGVDAPRITVGWATPPVYEEDDAMLDVTGKILAARLQKRLVDGAGPAAEVVAREASSQGGSVFQVVVTLRPGRAAGEALAAVDQEIAALATAGPAEDEVRAGRMDWVTRQVERCDAPAQRAHELARIASVTGDPARLALLPGAYAGATAAAVRRVAGAYLQPGRRVIVEVVPTSGASPEGRVAVSGDP